jgi:putative peptidoglycan lipid II flippase
MGATTGQRVMRATGIIGGASVVVTALGFLKNLLAAYYFGTSSAMDIYLFALVIPDMAQFMSITGLFNFIPLFAETRARHGEKEAWSVASRLVTYWLLLLCFVLVVCTVAAGALSWLVAPGLDADARAIYVVQTRLLMLMALGMGAARILAAVHNARKHFLVPALGEVAFQTTSILFLVIFHDYGTMALAGGMVLGGFCQLLVNSIGLRVKGARLPIVLDPRHPTVARLLRLTVPVYISNAGAKINAVVNSAFASLLSAGALSALQYAFMGVDIIATMVGLSLSRALFPFLSEHFAEGRGEAVTRSLDRGLVATTVLILPASLGLALLAHPVIVLLFQRGSFGVESTALTVAALQIYAPVLLPLGLGPILLTVYFAQANTTTPMKLGLFRVGLAALLCWLLVSPLGHRGIALATTISEFAKLYLMMTFLRSPEQREGLRLALRSGARLGLAGALMAAVVWPLSRLDILANMVPEPINIAALAGTIAAGAMVYFAGVRLFAPEDFSYFWTHARRFLPGRPAEEVAT